MKKILSGILVGLFIAAFGTLQTQEQLSQRGGAPSKPKFGPELARLSFLVGTFTAENRTYDTPMRKGGFSKGRNMNHWGLDSLFLVINYDGRAVIRNYVKGHGMLTFDRGSNQYKCWWFDNFGKHILYTGNFVGDTLSVEGEFSIPQGNVKEKIMWHPEGEKFKLRMIWDMGQEPMLVMERTATPIVNDTKKGLEK